MIFSKKIPNWIKDLPELDRAALEQLLSNSKGDIETPREMVHCIYDIKSQDDADSITDLLSRGGWLISVNVSSKHKELLNLEAKKDNYSITEQSYKADSALFNRVADLYSAHYDGWYASA